MLFLHFRTDRYWNRCRRVIISSWHCAAAAASSTSATALRRSTTQDSHDFVLHERPWYVRPGEQALVTTWAVYFGARHTTGCALFADGLTRTHETKLVVTNRRTLDKVNVLELVAAQRTTQCCITTHHASRLVNGCSWRSGVTTAGRRKWCWSMGARVWAQHACINITTWQGWESL
jgi:hypothetical protein